MLIQWLLAVPLVKETALADATFEERSIRGISLFLILMLVPVIPTVYFIGKYIYKSTIGKSKNRTLLQELNYQAEKFERDGELSVAAQIYLERLNDPLKAATLYEKCRDYEKAALLYETLGMSSKAKELYMKAGDYLSAAEKLSAEGRHDEAAKYFYKEGKFLEAARSLEAAGRGMAAVKAYREGKDYLSASRLLNEEGMFSEAAAMFEITLRGVEPSNDNVGDHIAYVKLLKKAGELEKASQVTAIIKGIDPSIGGLPEAGDAVHEGRMEGLVETTSHIAPSYPEQPPPQSVPPEEQGPKPEEHKSTIKDLIKSGSMEPRSSLRLWVQALKALQNAYADENRPYGRVFSGNIAFDENNTVELFSNAPPRAYIAPEVDAKKIRPDAGADIYSMGVVLHEMLTGSLEHLGIRAPGDIVPEVPAWLNDLALKCIEPDREKRFRSMDEIFDTLKHISQGKT